jgi:putative restriction endonuclease
LSKVVINVRPGPHGEVRRFNRVTRKNSDHAFDAIGSPVLLFAPRDKGRTAYFGTANLRNVELDVTNRAFLLLELVAVQLFSAPIPPTFEGHPYELEADGPNGELRWWHYSAPVRPIGDAAFDTVLAVASMPVIPSQNEKTGTAYAGFGNSGDSTASLALPSTPEYRMSARIVRSARVRAEILLHHGAVCALTDSNLVSPDGVAEVQVCHIWPLAAGGPDVVRNALPMTRTVHWGFDDGLLTLTRDFTIQVSSVADDNFRAHLNKEKIRANLPTDRKFWPDPECIDHHRRSIFRGS